MRRSGSERLFAFVRSTLAGRLEGSVRRVSVTHAIRSRIHRTEPARALITSRYQIRTWNIYNDGKTQTWIFKG